MTKQRLLAGMACLMLALRVAFGAAFSSAPTAHAQQQHDASTWWTVKGLLPADVDLLSVFMTDDYHAWIAGRTADKHGVIYLIRWNGSRWFIEEEQTVAQHGHAIAAVSDNKVWAVGEENMILKG